MPLHHCNPRTLMLSCIAIVVLSHVVPVVAEAPGVAGVSSCTAAGCHGAARAEEITGSEYNIWVADDPHANAYNLLLEPVSQQMIRLLDGLPDQEPAHAHRDQRCLTCHSISPNIAGQHNLVADGVSCEACHGPAEPWLAVHYEPGFQSLSAPEREARYGFLNTKSLARRAAICTECHVGSPGRDVNHDLIAAGHPRLQFEMGAYFAELPKHWIDANDRAPFGPEFDARLWAVGQAATSQAALKLLAHRASSEAPWPEFAEWRCAACHHDLRDQTDRQQRLAREGGLSGRQIAWDDWNHHLASHYLRDLAEVLAAPRQPSADAERQFAELAGAMRSISAGRGEAGVQADVLSDQLGALANPCERCDWTPAATNELSARIVGHHTRDGVPRWTTAAQAYDALASLHQSRINRNGGNARLTRAIGRLYRGLSQRMSAPLTYRYEPAQAQAHLEAIGAELPAVEGPR